MKGHLTKRGADSWSLVVYLGRDPATGKKKQRWVSFKGTKKDAKKRLAELIHLQDTGVLAKPGEVLLGDYLLDWLKDYVAPNLSPRTKEGYETIICQHLVPRLGSIPMVQLNPEHLQHYYQETLSTGRCNGNGGLSNRTVRHHHMVLHSALETALKWGLVNRNVAEAVKPPEAARKEMNYWEQEDIRKFLDLASGTPYHCLFLLALFTGMRRSELLALRWTDIDFIYAQISVSRSLHQLRDKSFIYRQPKSDTSRRTIALPPSAALALNQERQKRNHLAAISGEPLKEDDLVFSQLNGNPLLPGTVSQAWRRLVERSGLRRLRLHDARHTHATIMLKGGVHPKIVQERLGHSSIELTLETYSHVAPGLQEAAAQKFEDIIQGSKSQEKRKSTLHVNNFKNGDYIKIVAAYPDDARLQGVNGIVVGQSDEGHQNELCIKIDGKASQRLEIEGMRVWVGSTWLEPSIKMPSNWATPASDNVPQS